MKPKERYNAGLKVLAKSLGTLEVITVIIIVSIVTLGVSIVLFVKLPRKKEMID